MNYDLGSADVGHRWSASCRVARRDRLDGLSENHPRAMTANSANPTTNRCDRCERTTILRYRTAKYSCKCGNDESKYSAATDETVNRIAMIVARRERDLRS